MTFEKLRELDSQYVIQSYGRNAIAIDRGQGATLHGPDGREYIDFTSGIGVLSVGTANPKWQAAVAEQAGKLGHISNLYYSEPYIKLAEKLCTRSGMAAAFLGTPVQRATRASSSWPGSIPGKSTARGEAP